MSCVTSMQSSAKSSGRAEVSCGRAACSKSRNQMLLVLGPANFSPAKQIGQHSHHSPYLALHFRCSETPSPGQALPGLFPGPSPSQRHVECLTCQMPSHRELPECSRIFSGHPCSKNKLVKPIHQPLNQWLMGTTSYHQGLVTPAPSSTTWVWGFGGMPHRQVGSPEIWGLSSVG